MKRDLSYLFRLFANLGTVQWHKIFSGPANFRVRQTIVSLCPSNPLQYAQVFKENLLNLHRACDTLVNK